ncbi:hypothetical protein NliqN6_2946 [Naganishia liquefaciens]|uniref:Zn(2)-C6 fungal-type domain-containing protein n=1 Tax=Naganishia liquefaciens TaxID=104408 RepID=A0A8H3YEJ3_9TREE|nr:hypothetical protein NliqN6_2946 [Naganishia liquefaciens]
MDRKVKRTKVSNACAACQTRKSRCELLNEDGCHRCRVLGTECSLAGSRSTGRTRSTSVEADRSRRISHTADTSMDRIHSDTLPITAQSTPTKHSTESRLDALESRLQALEAHFPPSSHAPFPVSNKRKFPSAPRLTETAPEGHVNVTQALVRNQDLWGTFTELAGLARDEGWISVEEIAIAGTMRAAYLSFQDLFYDILPLREISSAQTPRHPFIQSIILGYLAQCPDTINPLNIQQSRAIRLIMRENLINALSARPRTPIVRALLVATYLPGFTTFSSRDGDPPLPDPQYIVQVAKSMALALGMDRAEDCMVGYTDDGWDGEDSAGMDGYLLWRCICQQEFWISLIMSPHVPDPIPIDLAGHSTSTGNYSTDIHYHVRETARLQGIVAAPLLRVQGLCRTGPTEDDLMSIHTCFNEFLDGIKLWYARIDRKKARHLYITAKQYDYALHVRLAGWIQRIPRPICNPWLFQLLQNVGRSSIQRSVQLVTGLSNCKDLQERWHVSQHVVCFISYLGLIHVQAMFKHTNHQDWTGRRHVNHLEAFEETLTRLYPEIAGGFFQKGKASVERIQPHQDPAPVRVDPWSGSNANASGSHTHATSDVRHHLPQPVNYSQDWPPSADGYITLLSSTSLAPDLQAALMPGASMSYVGESGEFSADEMAAFETWWFNMMDSDETPGSLPS